MRLEHLVCFALTLAGCADSTQFSEGVVGVWRLEDSALVFGSFRTDPGDCESVRVGSCERIGACRSRLAVVSAGTMSVERAGAEVDVSEPNADGLYLAPIDDGGSAGDAWRVRFAGAEVEPLDLSATMPAPVTALAAERPGDIRLQWDPPAGVDSVVVDISSPSDASIELQCQLGGGATGVVVDATLLEGASNLSASVTAYAEDREGAVVLRVGEPARVAIP
ncbi:MAG: hypothetical protein AB8I08_25270 [Sandaracinaceae bacterium]